MLSEFVKHVQFYLLIALFSILLVKPVTAGLTKKFAEEQHVKLDSTEVVERKPPAEKIQQFQSNPDFYYDRELGPANTFLQKLKFWILERIFRFLSTKPLRALWSILPYLIVAAVLVFVISRLMKTNVRGLFYRSAQQVILDFREMDENIQTSNLQELIDAAIREKKYQRAIRLLYLKALKKLTQKGLIDWKVDKTNHDYISEISLPNIKQPFAEITWLFEYAWYGDFPLDDRQFLSAFNRFQNFDNIILGG